MSDWIEIGSLEDIPPLGSRIVHAGVLNIAVFRCSDDKVYALENKCAHKQGPLSEGIVHGCLVTCPLHDWVFDMQTGKATGADEGMVRTFLVKVTDGKIYLSLEAGVAADDKQIVSA
jgi:nitrite reductase [NAD(P)H] small subunit